MHSHKSARMPKTWQTMSLRGLSPQSSEPHAPEAAWRWIAATPAFAGAGKCRD